MSSRIDAGSISTQLNPFGAQQSGVQRGGDVPSVGQQVQQALFGRAKPPVLDPAQFPQLAEQLRMLQRYKKKLAVMAGDDEDDYDICLADGTIAMIDEQGVIYVGAGFLSAVGDNPAILVGVLAHEIGHRPKRWGEYRTKRQLSYEELQMLCRHEETRADIFAGKALAEMELPCEPLEGFLKRIEVGPHPDYFPAAVRAEVIREAHSGRSTRVEARRKLFPGYNRMAAPKDILGNTDLSISTT
ncbi:MAG: hypothetical protein R3C68_07580 [Myxococcota bacterium]